VGAALMLAARRTEGSTGLMKVAGAFRNNANTPKYWQVLQRKQTISTQGDVHMRYLTLSITTLKIPNLIGTHKSETYFFHTFSITPLYVHSGCH
jgi:hypothetical protein